MDIAKIALARSCERRAPTRRLQAVEARFIRLCDAEIAWDGWSGTRCLARSGWRGPDDVGAQLRGYADARSGAARGSDRNTREDNPRARRGRSRCVRP